MVHLKTEFINVDSQVNPENNFTNQDYQNIYNTNTKKYIITREAASILAIGIIFILILLFRFKLSIQYIFLLLYYIIAAYNINCMIVGKCNIWAKINTMLIIIYTGLLIINLPKLNNIKI